MHRPAERGCRISRAPPQHVGYPRLGARLAARFELLQCVFGSACGWGWAAAAPAAASSLKTSLRTGSSASSIQPEKTYWCWMSSLSRIGLESHLLGWVLVSLVFALEAYASPLRQQILFLGWDIKKKLALEY